jgi:hypothetical protein
LHRIILLNPKYRSLLNNNFIILLFNNISIIILNIYFFSYWKIKFIFISSIGKN